MGYPDYLERGIRTLRLIERSRFGITVPQLTEKTETSKRTMYRILEKLALIEPIYTERRGKEAFYKFLRDEQ